MSNFTKRIKKEKEIMRVKRAFEIMINKNLISKHDNKGCLMEVYFTKEKGYEEYAIHLKSDVSEVIKYYTITN